MTVPLAGFLAGMSDEQIARVVAALPEPVIAAMTEKGWVPITAKSRTKLLFSKTRLNKGLGTADHWGEDEETV